MANICLLYCDVQDDLCELRLDIPLPTGADARGFESAWRATLAQKRLAQAQPLSARFRLCCADLDAVRTSAWTQYLTARLAALPGTPSVAAESTALPPPDWRGVRIWLAYRSSDLTALLKPKKSARFRGRRP
jgi:hypothetical protein